MFSNKIQKEIPAPKKVLFVTPIAPYELFGGTATVSRNLIDLFSDSLDVRICCLRSDKPGVYPRVINGAEVLTGAVSGPLRKLKFFLDYSRESFATRQFQKLTVKRRFAQLIAEQQPEYVIFDHIYSAWLIDLVTNPSTKLIYIAHDDMVEYADSIIRMRPDLMKKIRFGRLRGQYGILQKKILSRCEHVLAMTSEDADSLCKHGGGTIEVAPLFFEFHGPPREYSARFNYLLITGSFDTWEKKEGLHRFFNEVFTPLLEKLPNLEVIVSGRIPPGFLKNLPFPGSRVKVVNRPSVAEKAEIFRLATAAVVLDLQNSGLKIKTVELAADGLPLVSWLPGLVGTMLVPGRSCLLANSTGEFVAHLERLYLEPELRRQLGSAARDTIQEHFSREAAALRLRGSRLFKELSAANAVR